MSDSLSYTLRSLAPQTSIHTTNEESSKAQPISRLLSGLRWSVTLHLTLLRQSNCFSADEEPHQVRLFFDITKRARWHWHQQEGEMIDHGSDPKSCRTEEVREKPDVLDTYIQVGRYIDIYYANSKKKKNYHYHYHTIVGRDFSQRGLQADRRA